jgi:hypothetical protein
VERERETERERERETEREREREAERERGRERERERSRRTIDASTRPDGSEARRRARCGSATNRPSRGAGHAGDVIARTRCGT